MTERNIDPYAMAYANRLTIRMPYLPDTLSTVRFPHVDRTSPIRLRRIVLTDAPAGDPFDPALCPPAVQDA